MSQQIYGFYVSFSGEGSTPINNVYALDTKGNTESTQTLGQNGNELRGLVFGPDGDLYVAQADASVSAIQQFKGKLDKGSYTRKYVGEFVTSKDSSGLDHPYQPIFDSNGHLYVSSQDTNVVTAFHGPKSHHPGKAMSNSAFLQNNYKSGTFNPGTFAPAYNAKKTVPTPVPISLGGLTFIATANSSSTHSVRGIAFDSADSLYVADEGNNRVAVFGTDGTLLGVITASKNHSLSAPVALCFDGTTGTLYIGSPGNTRLFTYDVSQVKKNDFTASELINDSHLDQLSGIAVDLGGNIYTGSRKTNSIYRWDKKGTLQSTFAGPFDDSPEQIIAVYVPIVGS